MTTPEPSRLMAPTPSETMALNSAFQDEEIRALAEQMHASGALGFEPSTHAKAIITAVSHGSSPPTVSIQFRGDTTTTISGVRIMNNYSPVVGQTVDIRKQGPDIIITGHTADVSGSTVGQDGSGWILATLTNGGHNANSNGDIYYRLIMDHGSWKMQWRGGWDVDGNTVMIDEADALPSEYRPKGHRSVVAARQVVNATAAVWDFHTDGRVVLTGPTAAPATAIVSGDITFMDAGGFTGSAGSHNHLDGSSFLTTTDGSHDHSFSAAHDHGFSGGGHTHTVASPAWASLNGVEYFL